MRHPTTLLLVIVLLVAIGSTVAAQEGADVAAAESAGGPSDGDAVDATPEARARAMVRRWQEQVVELEDSVREADKGALQEMLGPVAELLHEMSVHVATGHEELLARALRLSALVAPRMPKRNRFSMPRVAPFATAGSIHLARHLWPVVTEDLDEFGAAGAMLRRELREFDKRAKELRKQAAKAREKKNFVAPNRQGSSEVRFPSAAEAAGVEAVVEIRYLIGEDGVPFAPEIRNRDVPVSLLLAALDAVLAARYEPAMVGTRLVPAEENVAMRFKKP